MSELNPKSILKRAFLPLRHSGFNLGISEYIAALEAVDGGFAATLDELKQTVSLLWCKSISEQPEFERIWHNILSKSPQKEPTPETKPSQRQPSSEQLINEPLTYTPPSLPVESFIEQPTEKLKPVAVKPPFTPAESNDTRELKSYYPISRRSMIYNWRYLRRPVADGIPDILDVEATITRVANQGFYLAPEYRRRETNHAHLLLLIDQNGSMNPFHHFSRDLVETAIYESTIQQVNVYYFHNVPTASVYQDLYLTEPISLGQVLAKCDRDTSVFIVSDAGAARGYRSLNRRQKTTTFLFKLKQKTRFIAWLNPMPKERWSSTSAQIITHLVPMFQMDNKGLSNAIDIVRGQYSFFSE